MTVRWIAILLVAASPASAEPLGKLIDNLRVDVSCADYWATPDSGLRVTLDGALQQPRDVFDVPLVGYTKYGPYVTYAPSDIGFAVVPGVHHLAVEAPGCAPLGEDIDVPAFVPLFVSGRLPVADASLAGTTGAPNGIGLVLGAYDITRGPHGANNSVFSSSYAFDAMTANGVWLATTYEHRGFAFAFDTAMGGGSVTGTAMPSAGGASYAFSGGALHMGMALRLGARMARGSLALTAGGGLGGGVWIADGKLTSSAPSDPFIASPSGADVDWYVPLWTSLTYKPSCNWGTQLLAAYDVHPGASNEDAPTFMAGLLWQPSAACSQAAGLTVR